MLLSESSILEMANTIYGVETRFWSNFDGDTLPEDVQAVVMGNGAFACELGLRPFVHNFLGAASEAGQPTIVVTYEDPSTAEAYKSSQRVVTLGKVVLGAADLFGSVHLVGHSWSGVHAANIAAAFVDKGDEQTVVQSLTLYTPNGYSGTDTPRNFPDFIKRCFREGTMAKETSTSSLRTGAVLAYSAARRFMRAPVTGVGAVIDAFRADQAEVSRFHRGSTGVDTRLAKLQQIPLKGVVAMQDALFPPDTAQANLTDHGFAVYKITGNHPEGITNPIKGKELFGIMFEQA